MRIVGAVFFVLMLNCEAYLSAQEQPSIETYKVYEQSRIKTHPKSKAYRFFEITVGHNVVFEYFTNNAGEPGNGSVAPARFVFEVDPELDSFRLKDQEIMANRGMYLQFCRCADRDVNVVSKGTITGVKQPDGTWEVNVDVQFTGRHSGKPYRLTFIQKFVPSERD